MTDSEPGRAFFVEPLILILLLCVLLLVSPFVFLLMLRCRRDHPDWARLMGWRYAHRGWHEKPHIPENSLPAFRRALDRGWGAELDVHLLKDGTLAVFHDSELRRCTGQDGIIEDLDRTSLSALRLEGTEEPVPLFDDVLSLFEGKAPLIIELKSYGNNYRRLAEAVAVRLDRYRGDYCIESFDPRVLLSCKRLRPSVIRGQLSMDFRPGGEPLPGWQRFFLRNLLTNFLTFPDFIAYRFEDRRRCAPRLCVNVWGAKEASWTICRKEDLLAAEAAGAIPIFEQFDPDEPGGDP